MKKEEKLNELRELQQEEEKDITYIWEELKKIVNSEECTGDNIARIKGIAEALMLRICDLNEVKRMIELLETIEN